MDWHYWGTQRMKIIDVLMVRVYILESSHLLNTIVDYLRKEANIRGVSVFRAVQGFGESGTHTSSLLDLSLNLPLAIEFFDSEEKIKPVLTHLSGLVKPEHVVFWTAMVHEI